MFSPCSYLYTRYCHCRHKNEKYKVSWFTVSEYIAKLPPRILVPDSGGFVYLNPKMFHGAFVQDDANATEAETMAVVQKPAHQSLLTEKSGPPAWKQHPTWYQVSEGDHIIPPDAERMFAKRMNATTISLNSSHASLVTHPAEIAQLILNATKGVTK
jgi:pimeloyl-ACP methyl ester carboxylesterase